MPSGNMIRLCPRTRGGIILREGLKRIQLVLMTLNRDKPHLRGQAVEGTVSTVMINKSLTLAGEKKKIPKLKML